jgi:hypothetical protein
MQARFFESNTVWRRGLDFVGKKMPPSQRGRLEGKVLTESRHTLREEKRGMIHTIHGIR